LKRYDDALLRRNVDACDTGHTSLLNLGQSPYPG
jgi:hypothetical protein